MTAVAAPKQTITIPAPNLRTLEIKIVGEAPLMIHRFYKKADIMATQEQGSTAKSKKKHAARDFASDFEQAKHVSEDGWCGFPASAIRNAMISACRLVGFQMTKAKLSVFCLADGREREDGTPLVRILGGEPEMNTSYTRNQTGVVDIRARPMWRDWSAVVRVRYDADQFTADDVVNLLYRAGQQVGIGEGRPGSKDSAGIGFGTFAVDMGQ